MKAELLEALFHIQQNLKVTKTEQAKNFKYRTCEGILTALKPLLKEHKGVVWFTDQIIALDGWKYLESTVHLQVGDDELSCKSIAREADKQLGMNPAQVTGSSSSYARKYALCAMFGIDDGNDPDSQEMQQDNQKSNNRNSGRNNNRQQNNRQQNNQQGNQRNSFFSEEQTASMRNAYKTHREIYNRICANYKIKSPKDITNAKKASLFYDDLMKETIAADNGGN